MNVKLILECDLGEYDADDLANTCASPENWAEVFYQSDATTENMRILAVNYVEVNNE